MKKLERKTFRRFIFCLCKNLLDFFLILFPKRIFTYKSPPQKILLAMPAHIGDMVMATTVLPVIKKKYPGCQIGMIAGSWSLPLVKDHPLINFVHIIDHFYLNRSRKTSKRRKWLRYWKTRRKALKEIKQIKYDSAIDLYFYFPSSIGIFYQAKIPRRIGYTRYGGKALLTDAFVWSFISQPLPWYYKKLLHPLGIKEEDFNDLKSSVAIFPNIPKDLPNRYIVIHMGCGNKIRKWSLEKWKQLRILLEMEGHAILFTGKGAEENQEISFVIKDSFLSRNLCDKLSFSDWMSVIAKARLVIGVDSSAGHIAGACKTPCIVIHSGTNCREMWKPYFSKAISVRAEVACAPCLKRDGCAHMACIRNIQPEEILSKAKELLMPSLINNCEFKSGKDAEIRRS